MAVPLAPLTLPPQPAALGSVAGENLSSPFGAPTLPVAPALLPLFPYGGLVRGSVISVSSPALALALLAPVSATGAWCAAAGFPALGLTAAAEAGIDLGRLVLIPDLGKDWANVVATALDGFDILLLRPPRQAPAGPARRIAARARERRSTVLVLGGWPNQVDLRLRIERSDWSGLDQGYGRLTGRHAAIVADGRGAAARPRRVTTWLPLRSG